MVAEMLQKYIFILHIFIQSKKNVLNEIFLFNDSR